MLAEKLARHRGEHERETVRQGDRDGQFFDDSEIIARVRFAKKKAFVSYCFLLSRRPLFSL